MKQKNKKLIGVLFLSAAGILLFLALQQWNLYQKGNDEYKEIISENTDGTTTEEKDIPDGTEDFSVDWNSLQSQNPDIVGWIRMDPTVNYPVVKGSDNSFYLRHGFNRSYNINGCIFMHYQNKNDWTDRNTIVYGHNMNSGAMFGNNDYYMNQAYAKAHPYFYIYVPEGKYKYKIFDTIVTNDATAPYDITFFSDEDFNNWLAKMSDIKKYGVNAQVATDDKVVTLSTCTSHGKKRFIIQGVLESYTDNNGKETSMTELKEQYRKLQEQQDQQNTENEEVK